ncbi:MAG TPA: glycosyltransferase family 39 protein [Usitatibacter sp.]|nr:glycosyltransferase family 39 protein [Usitatibacter sp.]
MFALLRERHPRLVLALLVAFLGAAGLAGIPPIDRDEPYFAQPARQMLETGDFVDIRFQDAPFYEKPILTYWLQAASAAAFSGPERNEIWAYRIPSVLAVLLATLLTYELGLALFDRRAALPGAALFASMLLVQSQAHQARADALLLASMLGSVLPLARSHASRTVPAKAPSARLAALFWISLAAAILIKGPVVPALIALAIAALVLLEGDWRWLEPLRPRWGVPLFLLLLLPWPIAMYELHGASFFIRAWQTDIFPKLVSAQESHGAPPLAYALTAPLTLWPATLLLPSALETAWRGRHDPPVRFCVAAILPGWLLFELAPTKLPHYILPLVPMLALLMTARAGQDALQSRSRASSRIGVVLFLLAGLLVVGVVPFASIWLGSGLDAAAAAGTLALLASVVLAAVVARRGGVERSAGAATLCGILASVLLFGIVMPRLERLWIAERAAHAARSIAATGTQALVVGYREPSLVFLLGTRTRFLGAAEAAAALRAHPGAAAIVASSRAAEFVRAAGALGVDVRQASAIDGIDPVHGRPIELGVWGVRAGSGASP